LGFDLAILPTWTLKTQPFSIIIRLLFHREWASVRTDTTRLLPAGTKMTRNTFFTISTTALVIFFHLATARVIVPSPAFARLNKNSKLQQPEDAKQTTNRYLKQSGHFLFQYETQDIHIQFTIHLFKNTTFFIRVCM
jgi:hypothetical protein